MKHFYSRLILMTCISLSSLSFACAPLTPNTTMLARLEAIKPSAEVQSYTTDKQGYLLYFSHPNFVFRSFWDSLSKKVPTQFEATFNPTNVKPHDLIIALSDYYNGSKPQEHRIYAIAPVTCQNNVIKLGRPILAPDNPGWNRQTARCGVSKNTGILDAFIGDKSQADYLKELQAKYPTCDALQSAYPDSSKAQSTDKPTGFWQWFKQIFS